MTGDGTEVWMGTLTVEGIRGRWGTADVSAQGDEKAMPSAKQIYERILSARTELDEEGLAA